MQQRNERSMSDLDLYTDVCGEANACASVPKNDRTLETTSGSNERTRQVTGRMITWGIIAAEWSMIAESLRPVKYEGPNR